MICCCCCFHVHGDHRYVTDCDFNECRAFFRMLHNKVDLSSDDFLKMFSWMQNDPSFVNDRVFDVLAYVFEIDTQQSCCIQ